MAPKKPEKKATPTKATDLKMQIEDIDKERATLKITSGKKVYALSIGRVK